MRWQEPGRAVLGAMWVAPSGRGQGVGVALVDAVAGWAAEHRATTLVARVFDDDAPALALCARLGFSPEGAVVVSRRDPSRTWRSWVRPLPATG